MVVCHMPNSNYYLMSYFSFIKTKGYSCMNIPAFIRVLMQVRKDLKLSVLWRCAINCSCTTYIFTNIVLFFFFFQGPNLMFFTSSITYAQYQDILTGQSSVGNWMFCRGCIHALIFIHVPQPLDLSLDWYAWAFLSSFASIENEL